MALIELRNVSKRFGRLVVLNGVSLSIEEGQSLVVIGASGSGKSVMLKHIVGLLKPDEGEVWYDGRRIDQLSSQELDKVREQFGFLFQMGALFDSLSVEANVAFPIVEHTHKSPQEIQKSDVPVVRRFVLGEAGDQELEGLRGASAPKAYTAGGNGRDEPG